MTIKELHSLKKGDLVVKVRKSYQNYDHTKIPTEPKVFTFQSNTGLGVYTLEASNPNWDNRLFCECCETFENYVNGTFNKDIVLDKTKWKSLEDFLKFKQINDKGKI